MPTIHIPKYPIVDPEPSVSKAVSNFNAEDWFHVALFTSAGFITGWFGGYYYLLLLFSYLIIKFLFILKRVNN
jgi:hypothetical protein